MTALAELIWNALDADATEVVATIERSGISRVEAITISDNGQGMQGREAELAFGLRGGSAKRRQTRTRANRRPVHGKNGKG